MTDSHYPYTYAADYIRALAGYNSDGCKLSRSDASAIRSSIADVLGMDDAELAAALADAYLANDNMFTSKAAAFISSLNLDTPKN